MTAVTHISVWGDVLCGLGTARAQAGTGELRVLDIKEWKAGRFPESHPACQACLDNMGMYPVGQIFRAKKSVASKTTAELMLAIRQAQDSLREAEDMVLMISDRVDADLAKTGREKAVKFMQDAVQRLQLDSYRSAMGSDVQRLKALLRRIHWARYYWPEPHCVDCGAEPGKCGPDCELNNELSPDETSGFS